MFIDIHGHCVEEHIYPIGGLDYICNPDELLNFYDLHGIEKGMVLPLCNPENIVSGQSNEEVLRLAKRYGRFIPFCNVDPRSHFNSATAPMVDVLRHYQDKGCKGVGEVCANLRFLDPRVQNLFAAAEEVGMPVTFHISPFEGYSYGLVDDPGLPQLEECLKRFPKLKFFGHSQAFWCEMGAYEGQDPRFGYPEGPITEEGAVPRLMRKYPNLYGDLSANSGAIALMRDHAYGVKFINEFQDRLFFGLDLCQPKAERSFKPLLPPYLKALRDAGDISGQVFTKLERGNAIRVLDL